VEDIATYARSLGLDVHEVSLGEQYRCGGSLAYVDWVERLLGLVQTGPGLWEGDERFALEVTDSPDELEQRIRAQAARGYSARLAAGYCWPWSDPRKDGSLVPDVRIGDWARPWNLKGDRPVGGAPPAPLWSSEPNGINQVGCVYTAQGFEYDWNGVIIGPDLVWRDGRFVSVREANRDPDFRNRNTVSDTDFDVLVSRGMIGTVVYSADPETRDALRALISRPRPNGSA
jgi:hypothetical protein